MDQVKIGKFIAQLRNEQALTQKELAEKLGVSDKTISKWECGRGLPEISLMISLCEQFGVSVNELLSGEKLDEKLYREKAEENIVTLMQGNNIRKIMLHIAISTALFLLAFGMIVLAAGKVLPPTILPIVFFWNILLLVANLVAGITYGLLKQWGKLKLLGIATLDLILLSVMIIVFCMLLIVFTAV